MRVLVTGISGFVGQHLARALLARGHEVAGTYLEEGFALPGMPAGRVALFHLDLRAERARVDADLAAAVAAARPERIVHLAGLAHVGKSWQDIPGYYQVNVLGTEAVLDAVARAEAGAPVLLASSAEVYGVVPEGEQPIAESRPAAPVSPYALTKAAAERLVLARGGIVVRQFNFIGPGQTAHFALPTFARQLAAIEAGRQPPQLAVGNLEARRDFVHVGDGAEALVQLVELGEPGGVYNVARGQAASIREALDLLLAAAGIEVETVLDERYLRQADIALLSGSAEPLRRLGWSPQRSTADAVADLWQWTREQVAAEVAR